MPTQPRNAQEAARFAKCYDKAQQMTGYDAYHCGNNVWGVESPEGKRYTVNPANGTCDCPDFEKNGLTCKHVLWLQITIEKEVDEDDEAAMWEAQCALWEDQNNPLVPDLPELSAPTLTVAAVLEALQARIVQDMDRAEAVMLQRDIQCFAVKNDRIRRFEHLQGALRVIGDYWTKERANLLDLTPAETVTL